jgi:hypothetical protein
MEVEAQRNMGFGDGGRPLQRPSASSVLEAATVPAGHAGAEVVVVAEQQWRAIRDRHAAGMSLSGIARELELDRKTVRRALRKDWSPYQRSAPAPMLLDAHRQWLVDRAPQVHYSARILYQKLRAERGYGGCYETVKLAVRPLRADPTTVPPRPSAPETLRAWSSSRTAQIPSTSVSSQFSLP